jgi:hypothetical protein
MGAILLVDYNRHVPFSFTIASSLRHGKSPVRSCRNAALMVAWLHADHFVCDRCDEDLLVAVGSRLKTTVQIGMLSLSFPHSVSLFVSLLSLFLAISTVHRECRFML